MKIIAFDLDDVLCSRPLENESKGKDKYNHCYPLQEGINLCNKFYDEGYYIKIYTARGMSIFKGDVSKIYNELFPLTSKQLGDWGIKYHELIMGKIHYDVLIDDKVLNSGTTDYEKIKTFLND